MRPYCLRWFFVVVIALCSTGCVIKDRVRIPQGGKRLSDGATIERVQIAGNLRISTDTVLPNLRTQAGDKVVTVIVVADIRRLESLGFEIVRVEEDSSPDNSGRKIITFVVREKN